MTGALSSHGCGLSLTRCTFERILSHAHQVFLNRFSSSPNLMVLAAHTYTQSGFTLSFTLKIIQISSTIYVLRKNTKKIHHAKVSVLKAFTVDLGPVVQSIVSLTMSLGCQLVKYMWTTLSNTLLFFVALQKILTFFQQKITTFL